MAKKLNAFEVKLLLEYRQYQDIKNLADKKCKELQKQVYQLIDDKNLTEKENFIFTHNNNVFSISEVNRSLTDMKQVREILTQKKIQIPVKSSSYYAIKNVTNSKETEQQIEEQLGRIANA